MLNNQIIYIENEFDKEGKSKNRSEKEFSNDLNNKVKLYLIKINILFDCNIR